MKDNPLDVGDFVVCDTDSGFIFKGGKISQYVTHFFINSVGQVKNVDQRTASSTVYLIGEDSQYLLPNNHLTKIDPTKTGKGFPQKICNICHCLKAHNEFAYNQNDKQGNKTTRPSCRLCRRTIDMKNMTAAAVKEARKFTPKTGTVWQCPICRKHCIVGVTAKVVLDHRHSDGKARGFLCDSCNTGLGRFKNGENFVKNALAYLKQFE